MAVLENSSQQTGVQLLHKPASIDEHLKQFGQIILLLGLDELLEPFFASQSPMTISTTSASCSTWPFVLLSARKSM